jgi:predicted MFS family arabinose efflux permease
VVLAVAAAAAAPGPRRPPPGGARAGTRGRGPASVYLLAVVAGLASAAGVGLVAFLVLYAVHSGLSEGQAGLLLGAMSLGATVSRIALGALADRPGQEPLRPVAAMLIVSVAGYLLLIPGRPGAIVVGTLLAGSVGWAWPGALTLAVVERSRDAPAWAVGVMMAGLFAGAVGGPLVVGLLADHGAFAAAWAVCAAFALLAAATVVAVRRLDRRSPRLAA